jgi:homoserine dehydrogenase
LGYAEADPSFDIDGVDAAHKLALLAATAFGTPVRFSEIKIEGIRHVSAMDIKFAAELGYRVKLLATVRPVAGRIDQRVQPVLVPEDASLAAVEGVFNAVLFDADPVGQITLVGRGAGAGPTASAVVADLIDLARGRRAPVFGAGADIAASTAADGGHMASPYYIRLMVVDRPGVIAEVGAALRDGGLSIHQLVQHGRATLPDEAVAVLLTTHPAQSEALDAALHALAKVSALREEPRIFRIEGD